MSDSSMQEKTEEATPRKRQEARDEGQVPRSQEMSTAAALIGGAAILNMMAPAMASMVVNTFTQWMMLAGNTSLDSQTTIAALQGTGWRVLAGMSAMLTAIAGIVLAVNVVQARGILSSKPLMPKFERINPLPNAKKMLGAQPWVELVKSLGKLSIVGIVVYISMRSAWADSIALVQEAPGQLLGLIRMYSVKLLRTAGMAYVALAAADYGYQLWSHRKNLMMTKEEVKQENKQSEGDPLVKARLRQMGRSLARRQMMSEVPNADVVVTNPTHIAVALKYDAEKSDAPMVLAMGQRKVAERIKAIARESNVPMIENKPLARAMLASCSVGRSIPAELYVAVAEVLAFVIRQRTGNGRRARAS